MNLKPEKVNELLEILTNCLDGEGAKPNAIWAISEMLRKDLFRCGSQKAGELIDIFKKCADTENAKSDVATAMGEFVESGLFMYLKPEKVNELIKILMEKLINFLDVGRVKTNVPYAICLMAKNGLLNGLGEKEIIKLTETLFECSKSKNDETTCNNAFAAVWKMGERGLLKKFGAENADQLMDMLLKSKVEDVKVNVVGAIWQMAEKIEDVKQKEVNEQVFKSSNKEAVESVDTHNQKDVAGQSTTQLGALSEDEVMELINGMLYLADLTEAKNNIADTIKKMAEKDLLKKYDQNVVKMVYEYVCDDNAKDII